MSNHYYIADFKRRFEKELDNLNKKKSPVYYRVEGGNISSIKRYDEKFPRSERYIPSRESISTLRNEINKLPYAYDRYEAKTKLRDLTGGQRLDPDTDFLNTKTREKRLELRHQKFLEKFKLAEERYEKHKLAKELRIKNLKLGALGLGVLGAGAYGIKKLRDSRSDKGKKRGKYND
jgi:hypothetical protein